MKVAAIIPCYRVTDSLGKLLPRIDDDVDYIYCVDDACPDSSYKIAEKYSHIDKRINVIKHKNNQGVGGAMVTGYKNALNSDADILVKIDGDGQMDPAHIGKIIKPVINGEADYAKGNRFYSIEGLSEMPNIRLIGNMILSFFSKFSTGYWHLFDPTNGFTAIHRSVLNHLPLEKLHKGYFFETDLLFRLNTIRAVVHDVPMTAFYGDEISSLKVHRVIISFLFLHIRTLIKRIIYNYFLRNFCVASINLVLGSVLFLFGSIFGLLNWIYYIEINIPTPAGTIMLAALPIIIGVQLLLNFIAYDSEHIPFSPIHKKI